VGDLNVGQLYQYGIPASHLLYSDTAFAALPNGTTLYAGQVLAPPSYWNGTNGKRYALDVVYQTGTTGTPNGGATTCTGTSGASVLTCSSATDLSVGQKLNIGTDTNKTISHVDATNASAVLVYLQSNLASTYSTPSALTFSAPLLGLEMQLPTKSSAAPTTLAWSQGDMEQNLTATANGVAAWVNVAAGTPGTWAGIPLGNSSGQINHTQISDTLTPTQICTGTAAAGEYCDPVSGWTTLPVSAVTTAPAWLQYLGNGADGAYEATAASCTSASPCSISGEKYYTSFQVDAGAYVYSNLGSVGTPVIHSQGACNDYGTILINGAKSTWPSSNKGVAGGSSGGSGGGSSAGTAGVLSYPSVSESGYGQVGGGGAGAASGGNGNNGASSPVATQRSIVNAGGGGLDGAYLSGSAGVQGGNSGGAGGYPGGGFIQICASINGTGGTIDMSGANGANATANSTGAGSGGGGGVAILSSQAAVSTWPAVYVAGGPGALATVPQALATSGSCTTQPKVTLGVTSGALSSCTVVQAGANCGTGTNVKFNILGGGGTGGTITPTWTSGALSSCTASGGSGYTAATYTASGTGGDGGNGWYQEFQGW
jgi:hypothetical protein